jgi:hypothetical protein
MSLNIVNEEFLFGGNFEQEVGLKNSYRLTYTKDGPLFCLHTVWKRVQSSAYCTPLSSVSALRQLSITIKTINELSKNVFLKKRRGNSSTSNCNFTADRFNLYVKLLISSVSFLITRLFNYI